MTATRYRIDAAASRFTVRAFATGMLSFLGHDPVFVARDLGGELTFGDDRIANLGVELVVRAASIEVTGIASASDRKQIEERMWGEVLAVASHPEVVFRGAAAADTEKLPDGTYQIQVEGELSLRGVARPHRVACQLRAFSDGFRLGGQSAVRMSEHGIPPVTALGGSIRLKDDVRLAFDLAALSEAS